MVALGLEASGYVVSLSDLPLEYERDYGTARGDCEISNIFDNPIVFGPVGVNGSLSAEQFGDFVLSYVRASGDDLTHSLLVRE